MSTEKTLEELELLAANFDVDIDRYIAKHAGNEWALEELRDAKNQADELSMTLQRAMEAIKSVKKDS